MRRRSLRTREKRRRRLNISLTRIRWGLEMIYNQFDSLSVVVTSPASIIDAVRLSNPSESFVGRRNTGSHVSQTGTPKRKSRALLFP
jgi:hypothetical protein